MSDIEIKSPIPARLTDPLIFIMEYCKEQNIQVKISGQIICSASKENIDTIFYYYNLDYDKIKSALKSIGVNSTIPKFSPSQLKGAFNVHIGNEQDKAKITLFESLAFDGSTYDGIDTWLNALTGQVNPLDKYAMQHFFWQIKRKIFGKNVEYPLLPVLFGDQGGGKSKAIEKITTPLSELRLTYDPPEILDKAHYQAMSENYINVFDEMSGLEKRTDIDSFKKNVSAKVLSYRPLYTQTNKIVSQNCTFIGSSNKPISQIINDPTGMRRFWQINCLPADQLKLNWPLINSIDALKIFKSIDENLEEGYGEGQRANISEAQQDAMNKGEFASFIEETDMKPKGTEDVAVPIKMLFKYYKYWRDECWRDSKATTLQFLPAQLETLGIPRKVLNKEGKRTVCFLVSKQCYDYMIKDTASVTSLAIWQKKA